MPPRSKKGDGGAIVIDKPDISSVDEAFARRLSTTLHQNSRMALLKRLINAPAVVPQWAITRRRPGTGLGIAAGARPLLRGRGVAPDVQHEQVLQLHRWLTDRTRRATTSPAAVTDLFVAVSEIQTSPRRTAGSVS